MKSTPGLQAPRLLKRALRSADRFEHSKEPGVEVLALPHRAKQARVLTSHLPTPRFQRLQQPPLLSSLPSKAGSNSVALLELLERKWADYPKHWSVRRRVLDCSLNPPTMVPGEAQPVSVPLIDQLSQCPLGRVVLQEAMLHMPRSRLYRNKNYSNIDRALKERSIQGYKPPKGFRSYRGYASDLAQSWENKRPVPILSPRNMGKSDGFRGSLY